MVGKRQSNVAKQNKKILKSSAFTSRSSSSSSSFDSSYADTSQLITFIEKPTEDDFLKKLLHPLVAKWFFSKFPSFTLAQKLAVYPIHCRENVLVSAPTGSSKTLTAFLAVLNQLVDDALHNRLLDKTYCVYISPLKALNYDIEHNLLGPLTEIENLHGAPLGIRVGVRTSDTTQYQRAKMKKIPPHILITTPESLGLLLSGSVAVENLSHLEWVILDEIHALSNKRGVLLSLFLELLASQHPFTRIGLSATAEPLTEIAQFLVGNSRQCKIAKVMYTKDVDLTVDVIDFLLPTHDAYLAQYYEKLHAHIQAHKSTLIFTNTRSGTEKVVHELKNRFEHAYYEINEEPPFERSSLIGTHHSSLSKEMRFSIEQKLREGKLKCVVCSTSLELGIDIGYIDQVILLHSPKSVSRLLQRIGRSGHKVGGASRGVLFSHSYEELLENTVIVQSALSQKIDRIRIMQNCFDVLCQFIVGACLVRSFSTRELYDLVCRSYCYTLSFAEFMRCVHYLVIEQYDSFSVYPKVMVIVPNAVNFGNGARVAALDVAVAVSDAVSLPLELNAQTILKTKPSAKLLYLQNIGTIVGSGAISVKIGDSVIGTVDEAFVEQLKPGDVFVLGGETYVFKYARGMTVQVSSASGRSPTVPRWSSQALGLSLDDAKRINSFLEDVMLFVREYVRKNSKTSTDVKLSDALDSFFGQTQFGYITHRAKKLLREYMYLQTLYLGEYIAGKFTVEQFSEGDMKFTIVHSYLGRYANEGFALLLSYAARRRHHIQTTYAVTDSGFYLQGKKFIDVARLMQYILEDGDFVSVVQSALTDSMHLRQRFRGCASRALLLISRYKGETKSVAKQQVKSHMIWSSLIREGYTLDKIDGLGNGHPLVRETYQEVMRDLVFDEVKRALVTPIRVCEVSVPSPSSFPIVLSAYADVLRASDKYMYIHNLRAMVCAKLLMQGKLSQNDLDTMSMSFDRPLTDFNLTISPSRLDKGKVGNSSNQRTGNTGSGSTGLEDDSGADGDTAADITVGGYSVMSDADIDFMLGKNTIGHDAVTRRAGVFVSQQLETDLDKVMRKLDLEPDICFELRRMVSGEEDHFSPQFKSWLSTLLSGTVSKVWSDDLIKFLKQKQLLLK
jgi:ATP-dependent helicase Lhr and Lhr-like helicase